MFSPGSNDPRASVPPNARDSTHTVSSGGDGLSDKSAYLKELRVERRNLDKVLSGRRGWVSETSFTSSLGKALCSSESGLPLERDCQKYETDIEGKQEWSMGKLSADSIQRASGSPLSNGSSFLQVSKRYPGRHSFYKENGHYSSTCNRAGDTCHFVAFGDHNGIGRAEQVTNHEATEAASGCLDRSMGGSTKDLDHHVSQKPRFLSGERTEHFSGAGLEKKSPASRFLSELRHIGSREQPKDGSRIHVISPRNSEKVDAIDVALFPKTSVSLQDDLSLSKTVNGVFEGRLPMCSLSNLEICSEASFISKRTLGAFPKQNSEKSLDRVVSISSRRSAFASGNVFSEDLIARPHASLDASMLLLSPKSMSHSGAVASSLGSVHSADNSSPKKRPRLGWGQGLAKYEQRKVEGSVSPSATFCGGSPKVEAYSSPHTDDQHRALKTCYGLPLAASFSLASNANAECLSNSEVLGASSVKVESSYRSSGDLGVLSEARILEGKSGLKNSGNVESLQLQIDQGPVCKSLEISAFEKSIELSRDLPAKDGICQPFSGIGGLAEENNHWSPKDFSGWTKQEISIGIEKLECEIDLVEKELFKLNADSGDDLQSAQTLSNVRETKDNIEHTHYDPAETLEALHASEEIVMQDVFDQLQNSQSPPCEISDHAQTEQIQQENEVACINVEASGKSLKVLSEEETSIAESYEEVIENMDANETESLEASDPDALVGPFSYVDTTENNLLSDMQKQHLFSVHALLEENQIKSMRASKSFIHLLPESTPSGKDDSEPHLDVALWEHNECGSKDKEQMLEKLAKHKHSIKFKEQVLVLKYRAMKELWKQEQLVNAQKRDRSKTSRRPEAERRSGNASVTPRSSLRLRPSPSGSGKMDAAPNEVKVMNKALADWSDELVRPFLRMPAMLLDDREHSFQRFISKNGLVGDPLTLEQEREAINPWTSEERQIFLDKFAVFNKNFSQIASYLEHKTTADCVVFYYKNHKSDDFEKIRRKNQLKKRREHSRASSSYLATTVLPAGVRNRESNFVGVEDIIGFNSSSRDVLRSGRTGSHKSIERGNSGGHNEHRSCISGALSKSTVSKESKAASNLLAVAAGAASGVPFNSCMLSTTVFPSKSGIESNLFREDLVGEVSPGNVEKIHRKVKTTHFLHHQQGVGKLMSEQVESKWCDSEKHCFIEALGLYGKDFKRIAQHMRTKTLGQCKAFFSKSRKRLNLDQIVSGLQTLSHTSVDVEADAAQPISNLGAVKMEDFVSHMDAALHHLDVCQDQEELVTTCAEATAKEPENPLLEPPVLMDNTKVTSEDEGDHAFAVEDTSSHHLLNSSNIVNKLKTMESPESPKSIGILNELGCAPSVCQSSLMVAKSQMDGSSIKDMTVSASEDCSYSPTKAGEVLKAQITESAIHNEEAVDLVATSCTASSGVPANEHEPLCKKPKLEADSPSISSSVPPEPPSSMVPHHIVHAARNALSAPKSSHLFERNVKSGNETRNRREATSWAQDEKEVFAETIKRHGKDWAILQENLPSKSLTQIKTYFQNSKAKLGLAADNVGSGINQVSRKRKIDESDTNTRTCGKANSQKESQPITNVSSLNSSSGDVNPNGNISAVSAEHLVYNMLARNAGQVVQNMAIASDMQRYFRQLGANGPTSQAAISSKQLSASGMTESATSSGHIVGSMQGQLLSNSLYANIQQQILSNCKHPSSSSCSQPQSSVSPLQVHQHQLTQSTSQQQLVHALHQQQVLSLAQSVLQSQQLLPSACQQLPLNHHPQTSLPVEGQASSSLTQKLTHQLSRQHSSSPDATLTNQHLLNYHVSHRFQQHQKQASQSQQQQLQQVAQLQVQNALSPLLVLQQEPPDVASPAHKQVIAPCHQQLAAQLMNDQKQSFTQQQQQSHLLNQQKAIDQQKSFVQQQQQLTFKHQQPILIQQQKQLHQTSVSQMVQHPHQFLQQQQLKKIALQQLNVMNQSQERQHDKFAMQMLQHGLHLKASHQLLQQKDVQAQSFEDSTLVSKQLSNICVDQQQFQSQSTVPVVKGTLKKTGSDCDVSNQVVTEPKRQQISHYSPEDSHYTQRDFEAPLCGHSRGESFFEAKPSRSGDVKLFGQSLLSQPSSSGSKSSSASPTGNGRLLLRPYSPGLLASAGSLPVSLPPSKYLSNEYSKSVSLDKEVCQSPSTLHHPGSSFTNMATGLQKGTVRTTGVLESHGVQEATAYVTQRLVQNQGPELNALVEPSTVSCPPIEFHRESQEACRDDKILCPSHGQVTVRNEANPMACGSRRESLAEAEIDGNYVKVDGLCMSAGKSVGQPAHPVVNQGISRGVLDAIVAISNRQTGLTLGSTGSGMSVNDLCSLRSFGNGLELPKGSGLIEVPNSVGHLQVGGGENLQPMSHNYMPSPFAVNVSKQNIQGDAVHGTNGGSHAGVKDLMESVPKHMPATSMVEVPLRPSDSKR